VPPARHKSLGSSRGGTIREILQRHMRRVTTITYSAFAGFALGGIAGPMYKLNCPACDGRLMQLLLGSGGNPFKVPPKGATPS